MHVCLHICVALQEGGKPCSTGTHHLPAKGLLLLDLVLITANI